MHISRWSARRSGPSMTVKGIRTDEGNEGRPASLTDVRLIETRGRLVVAVLGNGFEHILRDGMGDAPAGPSLRERIRTILDIQGNAHVSTDALAVSKLKDIRKLIDEA